MSLETSDIRQGDLVLMSNRQRVGRCWSHDVFQHVPQKNHRLQWLDEVDYLVDLLETEAYKATSTPWLNWGVAIAITILTMANHGKPIFVY